MSGSEEEDFPPSDESSEQNQASESNGDASDNGNSQPGDEEEDIPPEDEEEVDNPPDDEEEEEEDDAEPSPIRLVLKQPRQDELPPAKRVKSENPFEDLPSTSKDEEKAEEEEKEEQPESLVCYICQGDFTFPVMECKTAKCHTPCCAICLEKWKVAKLGEKSDAPAPCPQCRKQTGWIECAFKNKELGSVRVKCENFSHGCKDKVARNNMDEHKQRFCQYTRIQCKNKIIGCDWEGFRYQMHQHDEDCDFVKRAAEREKREAHRANWVAELDALEKRTEAVVKLIEASTIQAQQTLYKKEAALYALQECTRVGKMSTLLKVRKPDSVSMQAKTPSGKFVPVRVEVRIDEEKFFSIYFKFDAVVTRFPIWVGGFIRLNDPQLQGADACRVINVQFESNESCHLIFDEKTAVNGDRDLATRPINISIIPIVMHPNDPRD